MAGRLSKSSVKHIEDVYFTRTYYGREDGREYIAVSVRCPVEEAKEYAAGILKLNEDEVVVVPDLWYADDEDLYDTDPGFVCSRVNVFHKRIPLCGLIAVDMDATLLRSDKTVDPSTIGDIDKAVDEGVNLAYCTGRALVEMKNYFKELPQIRYAICYSGAIIYDCIEKKPIYKNEVDALFFEPIIAIAQKYGGMLTFLTEDESIVSEDDLEHMEDFHMGVYKPMYMKVTRRVKDMKEESAKHSSITKINIYFRSAEDREKGYSELKHLPLEFAYAEKTSLEMNAKGVTKGMAMLKLAELLGVPANKTMAIGDADNDIDMLKRAGFSVVMGNAKQSIKKLADMVTKDNDHNGVGYAIRSMIG